MEHDSYSNMLQRVAIDNGAITTNGVSVGNIIDTQGFESLTFVVRSGTITDGVHDFILEEGDVANLSDATPVPVDNILGSLTGFTAVDDDSSKRVGTIGKKRYQRLSINSSGVTSGSTTMGADAILGNPKTGPTPAV